MPALSNGRWRKQQPFFLFLPVIMPKLGLARIKGICLAENKASIKVQEVAILIKIPANTEQFYPLSHKSKICDRRLWATRSAALTAHRAVIHYRRLRFAYPLGTRGALGAAAPVRKTQFF